MTKPIEIPTGVSREEQETVIRWDMGERIVTISTTSPVTVRRMAKLGFEPASQSRRDGKLVSAEYRMPLARFRWGLKKRVAPGSRANLRPPRRSNIDSEVSGHRVDSSLATERGQG